jgi:DNA invertase Pin-like site-specific DNA recombinase
MRAIAENRDITLEVDVELNHQFRSDVAVQYIRRSSESQVKNNAMSEVLQDEKMQTRLEARGFAEFEKIDTDDGKSGQKMIEDRAGLEYLYDLIKGRKRINGKLIGAVSAFNASRLWRDPSHVYYNDFIAMLVKFQVPYIDYKRVYWPDSYNCSDMDALRAEFIKALATLQQITDYALPARYEAVTQGSYGGHAIPIGFPIVGAKSNRKYRVYEPHRELIEYLFKRFKSLHCNLPRLLRELRDSDFTFPPFDSSVTDVPHIALPFVSGKGYEVNNRNALISILTNRAYIGHYIFTRREPSTIEIDEKTGKRVRRSGKPIASYVNEHHHEAIIDRDLFDFAYTTLTGETLTGEVVKVKSERRYGVQTHALLEGLLFSATNPCYCMAGTNTYIARLKDRRGTVVVVVPIAELDKVYSKMVELSLIFDVNNEASTLVEAVEKAQEQTVEKRGDTQEELNKVLSGIKGWELDKESCRATGNIYGLNEANQQLTTLYARRDRLQAEIQQTDNDTSKIEKLSTLIHTAIGQWHSWPFEQRRLLTKLLVRYADVSEVTPHILKLEVFFNYWPYQMAMLFYRKHGTNKEWTTEENDILRNLYPTSDRLDVLKALPRRNWDSITTQARNEELKLTRTTFLNTSDFPTDMSYADRAMLRQLGIGLEVHLSSKMPVWPIWVCNQIDANSLPYEVKSFITS